MLGLQACLVYDVDAVSKKTGTGALAVAREAIAGYILRSKRLFPSGWPCQPGVIL